MNRWFCAVALCLWSFGALAGVHAAGSCAPRDTVRADTSTSISARRSQVSVSAQAEAELTPVLMRALSTPIPVMGSDGACHLVYELALTNFAEQPIRLERLDVLGARSGVALALLQDGELAQRLIVHDRAATPATLGAAQTGIIYVHLRFDAGVRIPRALDHRLSVTLNAKPYVETAARINVPNATRLVLDPPLRGTRYIAGDGCCDAPRHVRATLPLNGRAQTAQRFAIDWEELDEGNRIYVGDPKNPASYVIYGKPVHAVADARVLAAVDGLPDSQPGGLPAGLPMGEADGNHVVLDLGGGRFALYAHLAPKSVSVRTGQRVRRGDILGRVGTSGNSSEPHLHFQVTDGPSTLASDGVPYLLTRFRARQRGVSTAAFELGIEQGTPIPVESIAGADWRERVLPLDLWIVDFP